MDEILRQTLLYDFYGELLTKHQQQVYEDVVLNDLSCSEVAAARGVSRQGVHDLVRRCEHTLNGYEDKLHLVKKFLEIRENVQKIEEEADRELSGEADVEAGTIKRLCRQILEEL